MLHLKYENRNGICNKSYKRFFCVLCRKSYLKSFSLYPDWSSHCHLPIFIWPIHVTCLYSLSLDWLYPLSVTGLNIILLPYRFLSPNILLAKQILYHWSTEQKSFVSLKFGFKWIMKKNYSVQKLPSTFSINYYLSLKKNFTKKFFFKINNRNIFFFFAIAFLKT